MSDLVNAVLIEQAIRELEKTINNFNNQSAKQTKWMIILTIIIASLTFLMFLGLVIQICLIMK